MSEAGILSTTKPFEIIRYLSKETEYLPWNTALNKLGFYNAILDSTNAFGNYQKFVLELITPFYNRLGWDEKSNDDWLIKLDDSNQQ